ncbi:MAG: sulfate adenylyltransferase [Candidatus Bathyarchaeia archaeon]
MVNDPYGGRLVNRTLDGAKRLRRLNEVDEIPRIEIDKRTALDAEKIADGTYSPLEGFIGEDDFETIIKKERLASGLTWTIPILLAPSKGSNQIRNLAEGDDLALYHAKKPIATLHVEDIFEFNKNELTEKVYGTLNPEHPEISKIQSLGEKAIGGKIDLIQPVDKQTMKVELSPIETREEFRKRGWKSIAAYQTRNPPHIAHEYLQRCALEIVDGVFIHPIVGELKKDDFPPDAIIESYDQLIKNYYNIERVLLSPLSISMRYAGPKAAIFLAIIRKNYGCSHFIVGRDMAGVKNYYKPYEAHEKFKNLDIGIEPILFRESFFCKSCKIVATDKTCGHDLEDHLKVSMTQIRDMIRQGKKPPSHAIRPEILDILMKYIGRAN